MLSKNLDHNTLLLFKAFISSHAVFNALTYVQHQIASNESRASLKALSTFADFLRKASDDIESNEKLIQKEYQMLHSYCALEQWRFEDRVKISTALETDGQDFAPSFIFTLFTEQLLLALLNSKENNMQLNCIVNKNCLQINTLPKVELLTHDLLNEEQLRRKKLLDERIELLKAYWDIKIAHKEDKWELKFKQVKL